MVGMGMLSSSTRILTMLWAFTTVVLVWGPLATMAQSSNSCTQALLGLTACLPYIQGTNNTLPGSACCTPLDSILKSQPTCLCEAANLNVVVNATRTMDLATSCKSTIPASVTSCLAGVIGAAPGAAPSPLSSSSSPSPSSSSTIPSTRSSATPPPPSSNGLTLLSPSGFVTCIFGAVMFGLLAPKTI